MKFKTFPAYVIGGAMTFNLVAEGVLHPDKSPEPHVPHIKYFTPSTSNLSHTILLATAFGSTIASQGTV